ncbi:LOW QUALITY PROTEIN: Protein FAM91A1, partial [Galemys pyrenaicus]
SIVKLDLELLRLLLPTSTAPVPRDLNGTVRSPSHGHLGLPQAHVTAKCLRTTPFSSDTRILEDIMNREKSYDSLPNFTAADCLTLLSTGRNQYIDLMRQCRSPKTLSRRSTVPDLLSVKPVETAIKSHTRCCYPGVAGKVVLSKKLRQLLTLRLIVTSTAETAWLCSLNLSTGYRKRCIPIGLTLTAFLMMENLPETSCSHNVQSTGEGEARRYFDHAVTLRQTTLFLSHNKDLIVQTAQSDQPSLGFPLYLLCCESLLGLDAVTGSTVLNKTHALLTSIAPLTNKSPPVCGYPLLDRLSEKLVLSVFTCTMTTSPSKDHYLYRLLTSWHHEPGVVPTSDALMMLKDALTCSAIQGHGLHGMEETVLMPFPSDNYKEFTRVKVGVHYAFIANINERFLGYVIVLNASSQLASRKPSDACDKRAKPDWLWLDINGSSQTFAMIQQESETVATEEADWIPLSLYSGILPFSSELNQEVYRKIAIHGLCREESFFFFFATGKKKAFKTSYISGENTLYKSLSLFAHSRKVLPCWVVTGQLFEFTFTVLLCRSEGSTSCKEVNI